MIVSKNIILQNFDSKRFDYSLKLFFFQTSSGHKSVKKNRSAAVRTKRLKERTQDRLKENLEKNRRGKKECCSTNRTLATKLSTAMAKRRRRKTTAVDEANVLWINATIFLLFFFDI